MKMVAIGVFSEEGELLTEICNRPIIVLTGEVEELASFGGLIMQQVELVPVDRKAAQAKAIEDVLWLAEEGWGYASDYFRDKWRFKERFEELKASLSEGTGDGK
jgi:hypothetical protein